MKKILLVLLSVVALQLQASDFIKGEGTFLEGEGDSYKFVKSQLLYEGTKSILSKELDNLGLQKDIFWEKYNEKLQVEIDRINESLKERYKITPESPQVDRQKYTQALRKKRLNLRRKMYNITNLLPKFVIKKISRSQKNPKFRYIRLEGTVNSTKLTKLYYDLVRGRKASDYGSLFINVNYHLKNLTYSDLGIENINDFEGEIGQNWLEWFSKNKPSNIANAEILKGDKKDRLDEYFRLPSETMLDNIPEIFVNSLILDIEVNINKKVSDKRIGQHLFEFTGAAYLKDIQSNIVLKSFRFKKTEKSIRIVEGMNLANILANNVYQMAIGYFPNINQNIKNIVPISSVQSLHLTEFKNTNQIDSLISLIETKGLKLSVKTKLESITPERAKIVLFYDGEIDKLKTFLDSIKSAKKDLSFELIDTDNNLGIKFNREQIGNI